MTKTQFKIIDGELHKILNELDWFLCHEKKMAKAGNYCEVTRSHAEMDKLQARACRMLSMLGVLDGNVKGKNDI